MITPRTKFCGLMAGAAAALLATAAWSGRPAQADLSNFGTTTTGMQMPDNSGSWGPFQTTNGTLTFNTLGTKNLTVVANQKQIAVLPEVSDGWYGPGISKDTPVLKLTAIVWGLDGSVWFNKAQSVAGPWHTSFTWHDQGQSAGASGGGFGFYFAVQNNPKGLGLIGANGPNMGLTTGAVMSKRVGGQLNTATIPAKTLGIGLNNTSGTYLNDNNALTSKHGMLQVVYGTTVVNVPVTGVDFLKHGTTPVAPVRISLAYDGAKTITFKAVQGKKAFSHKITLPQRVPTLVGGKTAYVGFTGATTDHKFGPTQAVGITNFIFDEGTTAKPGTPAK